MPKSLISLSQWTQEECYRFFESSLKFKKDKIINKQNGKYIALVFFEPSTRTRMSFERAAGWVGARTSLLSSSLGTSLEKGESYEDTLLNIDALGVDQIVVRCPEDMDLKSIESQLKTPLICAGWGKRAHPTQALLDYVTLYEKVGSLKGLRVLYFGDIWHSRVLASHQELVPQLGIECGYWGSSLSNDLYNFRKFKNKKEALEWAQVVIGLRWQKERHQESWSKDFLQKEATLSSDDMVPLASKPLVLHPGPVGWGEEFDFSIKAYSENQILNQVSNGVFVRALLLANGVNV